METVNNAVRAKQIISILNIKPCCLAVPAAAEAPDAVEEAGLLCIDAA